MPDSQIELEKKDVLTSPIFIVGPLRSGTSMLRLIIGRHPKVNAFGEFEFCVSMASGETWPSVEDYKNFLVTDRQARSYNLEVLSSNSVTYKDIIYDFTDQLYERNPNRYLCSSVHSRVDLLPKLWPNAKYIHLLRDPRDVAKSCIGMGWVGNVHYGVDYWLNVEKHWDEALRKYPDIKALDVRYEQLVESPELEVGRICEFLGITYDDSMLSLEESSTYSKPSAEYANQWKKKLSAREIEWVENKARFAMQEKGYTVVSDKKSIVFYEKAYLFINNRLKRVLFNVKRWGLTNWLFFIISKKMGSKNFKTKMQLRINDINSNYLK